MNFSWSVARRYKQFSSIYLRQFKCEIKIFLNFWAIVNLIHISQQRANKRIILHVFQIASMVLKTDFFFGKSLLHSEKIIFISYHEKTLEKHWDSIYMYVYFLFSLCIGYKSGCKRNYYEFDWVNDIIRWDSTGLLWSCWYNIHLMIKFKMISQARNEMR